MDIKNKRFEVKEGKPGTGKGLFTRERIGKGDFIIEYTGIRIPTKEADEHKGRYLFEIDEEWTIDGEPSDNPARFINHSCQPNAEADIHDGHILISAVRDIVAGEEISIDYGDEYYQEFIKPHGCKCGAKVHQA